MPAQRSSIYKPKPTSDDPNDYPLNRFQFEAVMTRPDSGLGISIAQIEAVINGMPWPGDDKADAIARLKNAQTYNRNHPLFDALKLAVGVTDQQINDAWMLAKDLK